MPARNILSAIAWAIFILILSTIGGPQLPEWNWIDLIAPDKWAHAFVYGVLVILLLKINEKSGKYTFWVRTCFLICLFYGTLMEIIQYAFFPGRYFEMLDIIANIIGTLLGIRIYTKYLFKP